MFAFEPLLRFCEQRFGADAALFAQLMLSRIQRPVKARKTFAIFVEHGMLEHAKPDVFKDVAVVTWQTRRGVVRNSFSRNDGCATAGLQ